MHAWACENPGHFDLPDCRSTSTSFPKPKKAFPALIFSECSIPLAKMHSTSTCNTSVDLESTSPQAGRLRTLARELRPENLCQLLSGPRLFSNGVGRVTCLPLSCEAYDPSKFRFTPSPRRDANEDMPWQQQASHWRKTNSESTATSSGTHAASTNPPTSSELRVGCKAAFCPKSPSLHIAASRRPLRIHRKC